MIKFDDQIAPWPGVFQRAQGCFAIALAMPFLRRHGRWHNELLAIKLATPFLARAGAVVSVQIKPAAQQRIAGKEFVHDVLGHRRVIESDGRCFPQINESGHITRGNDGFDLLVVARRPGRA